MRFWVATPVRAGTYRLEVGDEGITGWHSHDRHQLEYAFEGVAQVETETARYLLPPAGRVDTGRRLPLEHSDQRQGGVGLLRSGHGHAGR